MPPSSMSELIAAYLNRNQASGSQPITAVGLPANQKLEAAQTWPDEANAQQGECVRP